MTNESKTDDRELVRFLQTFAPTASDVPQEVEDALFRALAPESPQALEERASPFGSWSFWASTFAAAVVLLAVFWFCAKPQESMVLIAHDLEKSWDGVLVNNQDIGLQSLFSDLD